MTELDTTVLNLLGKEVSFSISNGYRVFFEQGTVTDVVLSVAGNVQISIDYGDFYIFSDLLEFKVLD